MALQDASPAGEATTPQQLARIAGFIWGIADDVLRDLYVRGKYRDVILPAKGLLETILIKDDTELFKQFSDNESFRRWLLETVFALTYNAPEEHAA
jgi:hypothetical protein